MDILSVSHLTKTFGAPASFLHKRVGLTAVDDISFSLREGEILGLLGPNGAGKTTTIQMLLGVLTPTRGTIRYFGKNLSEYREEILELVNFSSTYTHLPWGLTVRENLRFMSFLYRISDRAGRIEKIISLFRLGDLLPKPLVELSAGQLTRVNLAKAFINFPRVLLLDEPTASLDPEAAQYIREFLLHERSQFRVSIILTSHNMAEVEEVCDRVVFIDRGRIISDDTPAALARSVEISHVEFFIHAGTDQAAAYAKTQRMAYRRERQRIVVDVREQDIAGFLQGLGEAGIRYDEVSIEKPTLEDYFLAVAGKEPHGLAKTIEN
ncbi:MAG: ABC transporter ATP-binding protein [Patescibacteria group bacterium]